MSRPAIISLLLLFLAPPVPAQTVTLPETVGAQVGTLATRQADSWGLTVDEWNRYTELRILHHGLLSEDLTPLEVLGILAETPDERRRFARMFATQQLRILQQIADFEADYRDAVVELSAAPPSRLRLVSAVTCVTGDCTEIINEALTQAHQGVGVDIYVSGASDDNAVRSWASHHAVPPELVQRQVITLNHAQQGMKPGLTRQDAQ